MNSEWKECFWGDIATLEYGKSLKNYKDKEGQFPVYGTNGLIGSNDSSLCDHPGVIVGRKGAYRGIHYSSKPFYVIDTAFYLKPKEKNLDLLFAYYELLTHDINSMDSGSAIPSTSREDFYNLPIKLPPIEEQKAIAYFLNNFDKKIELNQKMNQTLEEIGQAIFKHWFVHFEFPNEEGKPYKSSGGEMVDSELGEIPKGWEVQSLDKIADYLNGLALQKFPQENDDYLPVIKIRELKQGVTSSTDKASAKIDSNYIIDNGDVIFSWSGSLEVVLWCGGKGALNQHLFKVTSEEYPKWFYYYWTKHHLKSFREIAADKTTTMGHIKRKDLSEALVIIPPEEELSKVDAIINPIIEFLINNEIGSCNLSKIRDSLLPKLMSGKIRVPLEGK